MTCRTFALLTALLLPVAGGLPCMASTHEAKSEEPALALSVSYPARLAPVLLQPSRQTLRAMVSGLYAATTARFTTLSNATSITESLDALPVIGTMHRRAGRRFNTDDASINDFAICYRLSSRIGLQMIPGDPAPVKLAVTSMANNAGVTLGMTLRLSRR